MSEKAQRIIKEITSKGTSAIYEECKQLGIKPPKIEWLRAIRVEEEPDFIYGAYQHRTQKILLSADMVYVLLKEERTESDIIEMVLFAYFHEFSHYVDHKVRGITVQEYILNQKLYETMADAYAYRLLKRVK